MNENAPKLILLPGLAANERLFSYQSENLPNVEVPEWLAHKEGENLQEYAKRWAKEFPVKPHDFIGGMSFGGQVALELAKHVKAAGCFLISANRSGSEISAQFKIQNNMLKALPESFVKTGLKSLAVPQLKQFETLDDTEIEWLTEMVDEMDYEFFKWATNAAAQWSYEFNEKDFNLPIYQIHGENDSIIKRSPAPDVQIVEGGGHLINFTHAKELNRWLKEKMQA